MAENQTKSMSHSLIAKRRAVTLDKKKILLWFILLFPIADILTGVMIFRLGMPESFIGSPSQIIRICFLFIGLISIRPKYFRRCIAALFWLLIVECTALFFITNFAPFISGINYSLKILYIYIFYLWSDQLCTNDEEYYLSFQKAIFSSAFIYALGVIIPSLLGIGQASYSEGTFGQKGLIASGNAMGIYLGIITLLYILKRSKTLYDKLICILLFTALILLATKTALLFVGLVFIFSFRNIRKSLAIPLSVIILLGIIYYLDVITNALSVVADVIIFRYEHSDNLFTFLMSSRDNYVADAFVEFFKSPIWPLKVIVGGGAFMSFRASFYSGMMFDTLENEFFDIFFMYGIIGLSVYLGVIFYQLFHIYKISRFLSFLFLLFALHSVFAGHILFDGVPIMAAILIIQMSKHYKTTKSLFNI